MIKRLQNHQSFEDAFALVKRTFEKFVAPDYAKEGSETFFRLVTSPYLEQLVSMNGFVLGDYNKTVLTGIIAIRDYNHISLFFVDEQFHKRGIGRRLLNETIQLVKSHSSFLDVHSSPYAVPCYQALGFQAISSECLEDGIRFTPMKLKLE